MPKGGIFDVASSALKNKRRRLVQPFRILRRRKSIEMSTNRDAALGPIVPDLDRTTR
jgi:hypothetical protein